MFPLLLPRKIDNAGHSEAASFFISEPRIAYPALVANDAPEAPQKEKILKGYSGSGPPLMTHMTGRTDIPLRARVRA
jgi:hypothetical protein